MRKDKWVWMPHPGHLIISYACRFHLNTYLGNGYLVSTVGEWWPDRSSREIHAKIYDPKWHEANNARRGDDYDNAYKEHFGFEEIGSGRTYETMVFKARPQSIPKYQCCPWHQISGEDIDSDGYNAALDAYQGHLAMCDKWSRKRGL